ncbi:MAG TPA: hypothetical protein VF711_08980 [Acidimicrobiales bacterium]|jgi:hypothetical protein
MQQDNDGEVVRAQRFELVDSEGRVRPALGSTAPSDDQNEMFGLELFDSRGSARASLIHEERHGAELTFAVSGNQVLVIGTTDLEAAIPPGARVTVCDLDGAPVIEWHMAR